MCSGQRRGTKNELARRRRPTRDGPEPHIAQGSRYPYLSSSLELSRVVESCPALSLIYCIRVLDARSGEGWRGRKTGFGVERFSVKTERNQNEDRKRILQTQNHYKNQAGTVTGTVRELSVQYKSVKCNACRGLSR